MSEKLTVSMDDWKKNYRGNGWRLVTIREDNKCVIRKSARELANQTPMTNERRKEMYKSRTNPNKPESFDPEFLREGMIHDDCNVEKLQKSGRDPRNKNSTLAYQTRESWGYEE